MRTSKRMLCLVFVIVIVAQFLAVIPIHEVHATTYWSDDFENFSTGWDYIYTAAGGTIAKSSTQAHGGTYSVKVTSTASASDAMALKLLTIGAVNVHTSIWVYVDSSYTGDNDICLFSEYNEPNDKFVPECTLKYQNGAYWLRHRDWYHSPTTNNITTISANTWHQVEAYYNYATGKVHYYLDGVQQGGDWNTAGPSLAPTRIYIGDTDTSANAEKGLIYLDDLAVDNSAEPAGPDITAPTYSDISTNTTWGGASCSFNVKWTDETGLSGYIFGSNNTGAWVNETWASLASNPSWANVSKTLNATVGNKVQYEWWANDTNNNWNETGIKTLTVTGDLIAPTYSNVASSSTTANQPCLFSVKWTDETALATGGGHIFSTNITGHFINDTWTAFSTNPSLVNIIKTLNGTVGVVIGWIDYANDSSNNWNNTGIHTIITTAATPTIDWPMFCYNAIHEGGYNTNSTVPNTLLWRYATNNAIIYSSPAVVNGILYIGSDDKNVYALDALTGAKIWNYTTNAIVRSSPAVVNGVVFVSSDSLYALNASTGAKIWSANATILAPSVIDGYVYVTFNGTTVGAINSTTSAQIWNATVNDLLGYSPVIANGILYVWSWDGYLHAYNSTTGAVKWAKKLDHNKYYENSPAVANGVVFVGSTSLDATTELIMALDAETGESIWNYTTGYSVFSNFEMSTPTVVNGIVYITEYNAKTIWAVSASTGAFVWNYTMPFIAQCSPAVIAGVLYIGAGDRMLALNAATGAEIWSYFMPTTNGWITSSPAVVNGMLYFASWDNYVYALGLGMPSPVYVTNDPNTLSLIIENDAGIAVDGITVIARQVGVQANQTQTAITYYGAVNFIYGLWVGDVVVTTTNTTQYSSVIATFHIQQGSNVFELTLAPVGGGANFWQNIPAWAIWALIGILALVTVVGILHGKSKKGKSNGSPQREINRVKNKLPRLLR